MTMQTPPNNNVVPIAAAAKTFTLPEPGYPMLAHVVSNALFPEMQSGSVNCQACSAAVAVPSDKSIWSVDDPHPLVPELKVVRMFIDNGGIEIYSVTEDGKSCTRNFVPMDWIRVTEEVMPLDVFVEEVAETVEPGSPMLTRMISNAFYRTQQSKVSCPNCKAPLVVFVPSDEPVAWIVGQLHPHPLSGAKMKVMRMLIDNGGVEIYSISEDSKSGIRNFIPMNWIRLTEEAMAPEKFCQELEKAENDSGDDVGPEDPDDLEDPEETEEPEGKSDSPPSPANGQQTAPS
jgi:hypothetical protein